MIAPTTQAVAETFSAEKMYGNAAGTRSFQRIFQRLAAIARLNSTARRSVESRPRSVLIATGKNVRYAAITEPENQAATWRLPRYTTTIGATARIGTACEATTYGRSPRCRIFHCDMKTPSAKPTEAPSTKPTAASFAVKSAACNSCTIRRSPTPAVGCWKSACTIVCTCGIDVLSTTKGRVQPALIQIQR